MHITRFDRQFSRRKFLADAARGALGTGVLGSAWGAIAATGDASTAYPDELLSIENYTRGKIKTGDLITSANVEHVKALLDPTRYEQIVNHGRRLKVVPTTTDVMKTSPWEYVEATLAKAGSAVFDAKGNVATADGKPWIGGNPFPNPKDGLELFAAQTLSWGRHDAATYATRFHTVDAQGRRGHGYDGVMSEMSAVTRAESAAADKLRFVNMTFTRPLQQAGTSYLHVWDHDQHRFPLLYGYVPELRRVRQLPSDQRFEPLMPGLSVFVSDIWGAGDPLHTWGNYRVVHRGPFLGGVSGGWNPEDSNWEHATHGGAQGHSFWDSTVELVPEAISVEAEPLKFPRAPVSRKRVTFDARTGLALGMATYDRQGQPFRAFDITYARYESGEQRVMDGAHPYWSWAHLIATDIRTGAITRMEQVRTVDGHLSGANAPDTYARYMTQAALIRLGAI